MEVSAGRFSHCAAQRCAILKRSPILASRTASTLQKMQKAFSQFTLFCTQPGSAELTVNFRQERPPVSKQHQQLRPFLSYRK